MALTPSARSVALQILLQVELKQAYSNLELNAALNKLSLDRRESGLVTELVYGTISRLNTLDWMANQLLKKPIHTLEPWVRNLLRVSIYQLQYLERIPDRAIVHEAVEEAKKRGNAKIAGFVNGVLRNVGRSKEQLQIPKQGPKFKRIALGSSHPEWMVKRWLSFFGEQDTIAMCEINNTAPMMSIRCNLLKTDREQLTRMIEQQLPEAEWERSKLAPDGILLSHGGQIVHSQLFKEGYCTIQDESSMLVAYALNPKPGMDVLDTCAAPGGKTTHLAERMANEGRIVALDIHPHKLDLIRQNANRLGTAIIETRSADARELPMDLKSGEFDRILVDAPCSGFGVIRRKPDLKWQKSEKDIQEIAEIQYQILEQAVQCLKPGGKLVYSTCTVDPEENSKLVQRFVKEHPFVKLDDSLQGDMPEVLHSYFHRSGSYVQILPHYFGSDGFFISRMERIQ